MATLTSYIARVFLRNEEKEVRVITKFAPIRRRHLNLAHKLSSERGLLVVDWPVVYLFSSNCGLTCSFSTSFFSISLKKINVARPYEREGTDINASGILWTVYAMEEACTRVFIWGRIFSNSESHHFIRGKTGAMTPRMCESIFSASEPLNIPPAFRSAQLTRKWNLSLLQGKP